MKSFRPGPDDPLATYAEAYPGATRRTLLNKRRAVHALTALAGGKLEGDSAALLDRWPWLLEGLDARRMKRETILYALGTLPPPTIPEVADQLEADRPTVQRATQRLRRARAHLEGRTVDTSATVHQAAERIGAELARILAEYPDTPADTLRAALTLRRDWLAG